MASLKSSKVPHDVFISHSVKDKAVADAICAELERCDLRCWIAPRDIAPGENWAASILRAIAEGRMMVLVFSSHTSGSHHVCREVERAVNAGIPIAPVRIEGLKPVDDLEYFLSMSHWFDAFLPPQERRLSEFVEQLARLLSKPISGVPQLGTQINFLSNRNEAESLYITARYHWDKRTEAGLRKSIAGFTQALDKDPMFAKAWAGLADAYHQLALWGHAPPAAACEKAKTAAIRAVELDPKLAEAHTARAVILKDYEWNFSEAERSFRRALELNIDYAVAHQWLGECLSCMGRHTEAIAELKLAHALDPFSTTINATLARHGFFYSRKYSEAEVQLKGILDVDPDFWIAQSFMGWVQLFQENIPEALTRFQIARTLDDNPETLLGLGYALAIAGENARAHSLIDELISLSHRRYVAPVNIALLYAGIGNKDRAFDWLDKAFEDRSQWLSELHVDPAYDPLRSDSRFVDLARRLTGHLTARQFPG